eukprot:g1251.t1
MDHKECAIPGNEDRTNAQYFKKWDQYAAEAEREIEVEDEAAKQEADKQLGLDGSYARSEAEQRDREKNKALREAKALWDKKRAADKAAVCEISEESGADRVLDMGALGGKQLLKIKDCTGCSFTLTAPRLIKVFIDSCTDCSFTLDATLITSNLDISHCENLDVTITKPLATAQVDLCSGVRLCYKGDGILAPAQGHMLAHKIYHAGVRDMIITSHGGDHTLQVDYVDDGAAADFGAATPEEAQFVTQLVQGALLSERVLRVGERSVTQRELDEEAAAGLKRQAPMDMERAAEVSKLAGNTSFKAGEYAQAAIHYTQAIDQCPNDSVPVKHICLGNRAFCFQKLGDHAKALEDADACIALNPDYVKGHFRRGLALHALQRYREACPALGRAHELDPKNKQIKQALQFAEMRLARGPSGR